MKKPKVLLGMSGGVDSTAACLMLLDQGFEVIGLTMRVWDLKRHFTSNIDDPDFIISARHLAQRLGIEHHTIDVREEFRKHIVQNFLDEYCAGRTPNPCVLCNRYFKFRLLDEWSTKLGCDYCATGHYVKTETIDGMTYLVMADDIKKDQSYFLWRVQQHVLKRCLFPLGGMEKPMVRQYLSDRGFQLESKQSESMEVCFIENDYRDFLKTQIPDFSETIKSGDFVDNQGRKLGIHHGVPFYTVGQRKGLGIALGKPAYVLRLNAEKNTVVLGDEADLLTSYFIVESLEAVNEGKFFSSQSLLVRTRYHSKPVGCVVIPLEDGRFLVKTNEKVSAITPGQSAVFYEGNRMVGGAVIANQKGLGGIIANLEL